MERIIIGKIYQNHFNHFARISLIINKNKCELGKLPIHDLVVVKYALAISYFPLSDSKMKIYNKLNKKQKIGMLNRHILSICRKLDISQVLIKNAKDASDNYKRIRKYEDVDDVWKTLIEKYRRDIDVGYNLLLDIIEEEINKLNNIKYLRKKKIEKIYDDNFS